VPLALGERVERLRERLAAQRDLDLFVRQRPFAGDEVAKNRVLGLADGLVEARRRSRRSLDLVCLGDRQVRLFGDLLQRRLAS
jgi:hypothetical protein